MQISVTRKSDPVIPAKVRQRRIRPMADRIQVLNMIFKFMLKNWIPAFAGMTIEALSVLVFITPLIFASPPMSRGARPIALGNGYTGVAGDSYSLFYNPAGLAEITQKEFAVD